MIIYYGSNKYTYTTENSQEINEILALERYWEVHLTEAKKQKFGGNNPTPKTTITTIETHTTHISSLFFCNFVAK